MHPNRHGAAALAALLLLGACAPRLPPPAPIAQSASITNTAPICRAGPTGNPLAADRGIGGTGAPAIRLTDKGIGGTGIIGVITGFASICVGGQEVAYDPALPVAIDNHAATPSDLRAGQLAAIEASGPGTTLEARRVLIRHEVIGPVEAANASELLVAGQRVAITPSTLGDPPTPGAWLAVSGFRDPTGLIHATRLDRQPPGKVQIRGLLRHESRSWRIGTLELRFNNGPPPTPDTLVLLEGHYAADLLIVDDVTPDTWDIGAPGIPPIFGPDIDLVVVETFAGYSDNRLLIGRSRRDRTNTVLERAVIELERHPDGSLQPSRTRLPSQSIEPGVRTTMPNTNRHFEPAPVPSRAMGPDRGPGPEGRSLGAGQALDRPGSRFPDPNRTGPGNTPSGVFPGRTR